MQANKNLLTLLVFMPIAACAIDDAATGETEQDVAFGQLFTLPRTGNLPVSADSIPIGNIGESCFLDGLGGNLASAFGAQQPTNDLYTVSEAGVGLGSNGWTLTAQAGTNENAIKVVSECLGTDQGRTSIFSISARSSQLSTAMAVDDGVNYCYLTHVSNTQVDGFSGAFGHSTDKVDIVSQNGFWTLLGTGDVEASAMCLRPTTPSQQFIGSAGHTITLWPTGPTRNVQCMLTSISGAFRSNSLTDGVFIGFANGHYTLSVSAGKGAKARCLD